ncbi:MAG: hypothetical protein MI739_13850 [Bacteroidales bacterium]|nr:hypothetical protein [Bacteroidales bacterium]
MTEINELIKKSELALENAKHPDVYSKLSLFGFTNEKLATDRLFVDEAKKCVLNFQREYGESDSAYQAMSDTKKLCHNVYMTHVRIARVALRDEKAGWTELAIDGRRKYSIADYLIQADTFYINLLANDNFKQKMAVFGQTEESLTEGKALVEKLKQAYAKYKKEKGEAEKSTELKLKAADKLADWYSCFRKIAKVALNNDPQMLETLGILARSN